MRWRQHQKSVRSVVGLVLILVACGQATTTPVGISSTSAPAATQASEVDALRTFYRNLPQEKTAEGYYALGRPDAPITMQFYSDFL